MPYDETGVNGSAAQLMNDPTAAAKMEALATAAGDILADNIAQLFVRWVWPDYLHLEEAYQRALADHPSWLAYLDVYRNQGDLTTMNIVDWW